MEPALLRRCGGLCSPLPHTMPMDRYISQRESQDNSLSRFLLTTKENMAPLMALSQQYSPHREDSLVSPTLEVGSVSQVTVNAWLPVPGLPHHQTLPEASSPPLDSSFSTAMQNSPGRARSPPASAVIAEVFTRLRLDSHGESVESSSDPLLTPSSTHHQQEATPSGGSAMTSANRRSILLDVEPYTTRLARNLFSDALQTSVLGIHSSGNRRKENDAMTELEGGTRGHACHGVGISGMGCGERSPISREEERFATSLGVVYGANRCRNFTSKNFRVIAQTPERILDAADIVDDFYMNLMDWSSKGVLSVALQSCVYLWESSTCKITQLPPPPEERVNGSVFSSSGGPLDESGQMICGVRWSLDGRYLAIGYNNGHINMWDVGVQQIVNQWHEHVRRVGSLSWTSDGTVLASGSKDATIRLQDLREPGGRAGVLMAHTQEVCGLNWSPHHGNIHLASGGNDNQLLVWDRRLVRTGSGMDNSMMIRSVAPLLYLNQHKAAVKALAWHPIHSSLLVSGGGTDDKTLRFWNTLVGDCTRCLNTHSQVCGVLWNHPGTELISSHGFSKNQLSIWKYPSLRHVADLTGHTSRVLHLCLSPDGETVASAAGDETIRFWRCFQPSSSEEKRTLSSVAASSSSAFSIHPTRYGDVVSSDGTIATEYTHPCQATLPVSTSAMNPSSCNWTPGKLPTSLHADPAALIQVGFR